MIRQRFEPMRFRDLDCAAINVDLQVHTTWTDGFATVQEMLAVAAQRRIATIAVTEHVRRDTDWFATFVEEARWEARAQSEVKLLVGCEAKALDDAGTLDVCDEIRAQCDLVLGSVHRFPDGRGGFLDFKTLDYEECAWIECELSIGLLKAAPIDVLAHPGGMTLRQFGKYPEPLFRRMFETSLDRGVAIEINSSYLTELGRFLALCREINPFVSIGSDAHRSQELGRCRDRLMELPPFA